MSVLAWLAAGAVGSWTVWAAGRSCWRLPRFSRVNYRGSVVPVAGGIALALPVTVLAAVHGRSRGWLPVLIAAAGFGALGLLDDLAGPRDGQAPSGFRGHLGALRHGQVTTGAVKLAGGAGVALGAAVAWRRGFGWWALADAALIALSANLANLLDRAPGRTSKVALAAGAGLLAADGAALGGVAVAVGGAAALLPYDLGERLMLGDCGANALGAVLGVGVVAATGPGARLGILALLAGLNALSEIFSFSRIIERVRLLRALDGAGRRR